MTTSAIVAACCCDGPSRLYVADLCPNFFNNACFQGCRNCCDGPGIEKEIYLCDWWLSSELGISTPLDPTLCYYIKYLDCVYVLRNTFTGNCPPKPGAGVWNEGTLHSIVTKGAEPCCRGKDPNPAPCQNDLIVEAFPYEDPWGTVYPVYVSGAVKMCTYDPAPDTINSRICWPAGEYRPETYNEVSVDTTQQIGKCFERGGPENWPAIQDCGGGLDTFNDYFKFELGDDSTIQGTEDYEPCDCSGEPGWCDYTASHLECYPAGDCPGWPCASCPGAGDPVYDACVAARNASDPCAGQTDPRASYTVRTLYKIIQAYEKYPCGDDIGTPCTCAYFKQDVLRISFPLCFAVEQGLDPFSTNPATIADIKGIYLDLVQTQNGACDGCLVNTAYGPEYVTCLQVCNWLCQTFSGTAGHIAQKINDRFGGNITASSISPWGQYFWFGKRQSISDCGGGPNLRPPYSPGDLLYKHRAEIDTAAWKVYVYLKGWSPSFYYCAKQEVTAPAGQLARGVAICMSTNTVSPAEWASGLRPNMEVVETSSSSTTDVCICPYNLAQTDCTTTGTYPQVGTTVGIPPSYVPGYKTDFGAPCTNDFLSTGCRIYGCEYPGATCDDCDNVTIPTECCDCSFGPFGGGGGSPNNCSPPVQDCVDHTEKCNIPSNQALSIT